ncbi:MAG: hypothetical protein ACLRM9_02910 [Collinsella aerofaciens]
MTMAGEPGPNQRVAAVAQDCRLSELPLEFEDERLSSQEAKQILRAGAQRKQMGARLT